MKKEFYIRKEQELVTKLNDLNKHHYLYAWLKLLLFVLLVISFSIGFYDRQIYALLLGLILIVVFMFLLNKQTKIEWQLSLNKATLKTVEGMQFNRGYISPYFVTNRESSNVVFEDCYVLLVGKTISRLNEVVPILEQIARESRPVLIIAENVEILFA